MLPLTIGSQRFETIARRHAKIAQHPRLIKRRNFLRATFWMPGGSFRLRRPDQINSVSESAKLWIITNYNATRYGRQSPARASWVAMLRFCS
jgi:hypothetical protein